MAPTPAPKKKAAAPQRKPVTRASGGAVTKALADTRAELVSLKADLATLQPGKPVYTKGRSPAELFHATSGPVGRDSAGYSMLRAAAFCNGLVPADQAKEEIETHRRLKAVFGQGPGAGWHYQGKSFLMPFSTSHIPRENGGEKLVPELRQKLLAGAERVDPDEAAWLTKKLGVRKALGTTGDTAGGVLVGFPTLGELIDLQRHMEVISQCGAQEITLPPNGRIQFPKLTNGATSNWIGEGATITSSQPTTGNLNLEGKKLATYVPLNNELIRYAGPTAEAMVRNDMAKVSALAADLAQLQGTGGTQPLGVTNYPTTTTWDTGTDKVIAHTSVGSPADANSGYPFQPEDILLMEGKLPDAVEDGTAWVVRKDWLAYILNRRADAVTAGDGKGPFVFEPWRSIQEKRAEQMIGTKLVRSRQVSNTRTRGTGATFTYTLLGYWPDWIVGRFGVMEFLSNNLSDTAFQADQTILRGIQILDAGARHPASFVICDALAFA